MFPPFCPVTLLDVFFAEGMVLMAKKVLWIDDSPEQVADIAEAVRDAGFPVELVASASEGAFLLADEPEQFVAVIADLLMSGESITVPGERGPELLDTFHGLEAGLAFGRWVKRRFPGINVIGVSVKADSNDEQVQWFNNIGEGYFDKYSLYRSSRPLVDLLASLTGAQGPARTLKTYVIQSEDNKTTDEVLRYLQKMLRIPEPIIIRDASSLLETVTDDPATFTLTFVLLSAAPSASESAPEITQQKRARQNALFGAGFFYAKCQGEKGKLIFLYKNSLERPFDIQNAAFIDISKGVEAADGRIRQEVDEYLPLLRKK